MATDDQRSTETPLDEDDAVWSLASSLAGTETLQALAETVARAAGRAAGASFADLTVIEPTTSRLRVLLAVAGFASVTADAVFDLTESLPACHAIRSGLPVLLGSIEEIARRYPDLEGQAESAGMGAGAVLPLRSASGSSLGAIGFGWHEAQSFSAGQLRRLDLIAQLTGLALERVSSDGSPQGDGAALSALESMPNIFLSLDRELGIRYANAEAERALNSSRPELVGRDLAAIFPDAFGSGFALHCREAIERRRPLIFEEYCAHLDPIPIS